MKPFTISAPLALSDIGDPNESYKLQKDPRIQFSPPGL